MYFFVGPPIKLSPTLEVWENMASRAQYFLSVIVFCLLIKALPLRASQIQLPTSQQHSSPIADENSEIHVKYPNQLAVSSVPAKIDDKDAAVDELVDTVSTASWDREPIADDGFYEASDGDPLDAEEAIRIQYDYARSALSNSFRFLFYMAEAVVLSVGVYLAEKWYKRRATALRSYQEIHDAFSGYPDEEAIFL